MRPRPDAAENTQTAGDPRLKPQDIASMRPRPDAAENPRPSGVPRTTTSRFNEAAARCRGKLWTHARWPCRGGPRFNEAAARCRGKRCVASIRGCAVCGFNEAAARCRGKLPQLLRGRGDHPASMRPRPDAAENRGEVNPPGSRRPCFNEAAARCRGKPIGSVRPFPCPGASMRPRPDAAENAPAASVIFVCSVALQ